MIYNFSENNSSRENMLLIESKYKDTCSKLTRENQNLIELNSQLQTNIEILNADSKENVNKFAQISEKQTMELLQKGLKDELKRKDKELEGLRSYINEHEKEIAKLREKVKYQKDVLDRKATAEEKEENKWKEACQECFYCNLIETQRKCAKQR